MAAHLCHHDSVLACKVEGDSPYCANTMNLIAAGKARVRLGDGGRFVGHGGLEVLQVVFGAHESSVQTHIQKCALPA